MIKQTATISQMEPFIVFTFVYLLEDQMLRLCPLGVALVCVADRLGGSGAGGHHLPVLQLLCDYNHLFSGAGGGGFCTASTAEARTERQ